MTDFLMTYWPFGFLIAILMLGAAGRNLAERTACGPFQRTATSGHVKPSQTWLRIELARGVLASFAVLIFVVVRAVQDTFHPWMLAPLAVLLLLGLVSIWLFTLPGFRGKRDIIWDDKGLAGPQRNGSIKRIHLPWSEMEAYTPIGKGGIRIKGREDKTVFWDSYYEGHEAIEAAIGQYRPDLMAPAPRA